MDPRGTRVDPPSKWTRKDSRGQAWTRQYRPVDPRGSKRDPSKTRDRLCFPRSKWSTAPPKPAFAGASFGGSRSTVHGETCLAWTFLHSKRKLRSFAELTPAECPTAEPWDDSTCQPLAQTAYRLDVRWPKTSLAQIAEIIYGSGNHEKFNLREAFTVDIDGVWRLLVIPYDSEPAPTAGIEPGKDAATGFAYSYVACHGTHMDAARGIATDGFVRPSAWSGCIEGQNGSFATAGFNCQATLGHWTEWTIKITTARALKTPKGQQGVLVGTETHSKCQHLEASGSLRR